MHRTPPDPTPDLLALPSARLDALFRDGLPGPIPNGESRGTALVMSGTPYARPLAALIRTFAWQGKTFDAQRRRLHNKVLPFGLRAVVAEVYVGPSLLDGKDCVVLDYSRTSLIARWIRDEIRQIAPGFYLGRAYWKPGIRFLDFALRF